MNVSSLVDTIFRILTKKEVLIALVVIIPLVIAGSIYTTTQNTEGVVYPVVRQPLEQQVLFSGAVIPQTRVILSFERSGKIESLPYTVGDTVMRNGIIASLNADAATAAYQREVALLDSENAILDELLGGNRSEEVAVVQAQLEQSNALLTESTEGLVAAIINAVTVVDTAMERTAKPLFNDPDSNTPTIKYTTTNRSLEIELENEHLQMNALLKSWKNEVSVLKKWQSFTKSEGARNINSALSVQNLLGAAIAAVFDTTTEPDFAALAQTARNNLVRTTSFFQDLGTYTGVLSLSSNLSQTDINTYVANVSIDRANIQTALASLSTKREAYISAQTSLAVSTQELDLSSAGPRIEDVSTQRAKIRAQESAVQSAAVELDTHVLRAPFNAIVTERFVEKGELVTTGTQALTLDADGTFEVEARVSELDVVLIEEGMVADVTTDAYGSDISFPATLTRIDPAESIVDGVAGYGVTLTLGEDANILKAGMTANVSINVVLSEDALVIPAGLVERTAEGAFVYVLRDGKRTRTPVTLGLETIDGLVNILTGVEEDDRIVPYEETRN
ncbi:efflux RND transporter periplasmic adaptor subunit [Candidatus Kaiserbacteria bacterium]|nr:MAG: efflux RND transporter periplasmic adaptor subunit [Candidatus Kaiserbacteria bacterium]